MMVAEILCFKVQVLLESMVRTFVSRRTWVSAILIFFSSLLPWAASHLIPAFRTFFLILAPQLWQGAMQWLTQPVLFLLVNFVIVTIWITSNTECHANSDVGCDAKVQSIGAAAPEKLPQMISSSSPENSPSSSAVQEQSSLNLCKIEMPEESQTIDPPCTSIAADAKEKDAESSQPTDKSSKNPPNLKGVERRLSAPEKKPKIKAKSITRRNSEKTAAAAVADSAETPSSEETTKQKHKFEKKCRSFPQAPSSVIVRDISAAEDMDPDSPSGRREAMVIDKDELNDRIEAFFAKFRQQLRLQRQESLRRRQYWGCN